MFGASKFRGLSLLLIMMIGCLLPCAAGTDDRDGIKAGIRDSTVEMRRALRRGDAERLTGYYTEDAEIYGLGQACIKGREQILNHMRYMIERGVARFESDVEEIIYSEDSAVEIGHSYFYDRDENRIGTSRHLTVWKMVKGTWRIHRTFTNR
ncbi:MAG: SgcJ/EcaC family oxidoreductase [bacterium]|nr:SgcJ/EcaC family oxidoreductase [bacterium]